MADSPRYTLSRILQAADAAGLTPQQRARFLATLEGKRAPQGRPSRQRLAKQKEEDPGPAPPGIDPARWAEMAWFWRMSSGKQMALLFIGVHGLFEEGQKALLELAKDGRFTPEQLRAFGILSEMVTNFLRDWQTKLRFHFAMTKPSEGRPLKPDDLLALIADLIALPKDKKPTPDPESGTPK